MILLNILLDTKKISKKIDGIKLKNKLKDYEIQII